MPRTCGDTWVGAVRGVPLLAAGRPRSLRGNFETVPERSDNVSTLCLPNGKARC
jgi:hypothetical protein